MLPFKDFLKASDCVIDRDIFSRCARKCFCNKERLGQKTLYLSGPGYDEFVILGQFVHAQNGDDVAQLAAEFGGDLRVCAPPCLLGGGNPGSVDGFEIPLQPSRSVLQDARPEEPGAYHRLHRVGPWDGPARRADPVPRQLALYRQPADGPRQSPQQVVQGQPVQIGQDDLLPGGRQGLEYQR